MAAECFNGFLGRRKGGEASSTNPGPRLRTGGGVVVEGVKWVEFIAGLGTIATLAVG